MPPKSVPVQFSVSGTISRLLWLFCLVFGTLNLATYCHVWLQPVLEVTPVVSSSRALVPGPGDVVIAKVGVRRFTIVSREQSRKMDKGIAIETDGKQTCHRAKETA
jgi:hypothetical protein